MSGHVGNLDRKQEAALEKFRQNVADTLKPEHDDYFLLRWLRARQFDIKKSEAMLRTNISWRAKMGADKILEDFHLPVLKKYFTGGFFGFTKMGSPIFVDPFGYIDVKGIFRSAKKSDIARFEMYLAETMMKLCREQTQKLGRKVETFCTVFDLTNYGLKHLSKMALEFQIELLQLFEDNYPETMEVAIMINAPAIFPFAYKMFTPFLSEDTKRKVRIRGHDYIDDLLKYIDPDQLPEWYGGTAQDPPGDPTCSAAVSWGGDIPKSFYQEVVASDKQNWSVSTVKKRSTVQLDYNVTVPGTILRWQFCTESHDIGFGVYKRTTDKRQSVGEMTAVKATERVNSHMVPEEGHVVCDSIATYILRFDNTFSWNKSKTVCYSIDLLQPNADQFQTTDENEAQVAKHVSGDVQDADEKRVDSGEFEFVSKSSPLSDESEFFMMPKMAEDTKNEYELLNAE